MAVKTITKAQLSRELGVSKSRVTQLVRKGLPVRLDGKLDAVLVRDWVRLNVSGPRIGKRQDHPAPEQQTDRPETDRPETAHAEDLLDLVRQNAAVVLPRVARRLGMPEEKVAGVSNIFGHLLLVLGNYDELTPEYAWQVLAEEEEIPPEFQGRGDAWAAKVVEILEEEFKKLSEEMV